MIRLKAGQSVKDGEKMNRFATALPALFRCVLLPIVSSLNADGRHGTRLCRVCSYQVICQGLNLACLSAICAPADLLRKVVSTVTQNGPVSFPSYRVAL